MRWTTDERAALSSVPTSSTEVSVPPDLRKALTTLLDRLKELVKSNSFYDSYRVNEIETLHQGEDGSFNATSRMRIDKCLSPSRAHAFVLSDVKAMPEFGQCVQAIEQQRPKSTWPSDVLALLVADELTMAIAECASPEMIEDIIVTFAAD